jgi:hypothetical protein
MFSDGNPDAHRRVGQRNSLRGNSFEHPHIALWLAGLGPGDILDLTGTEDGEVIRADGHRTVYQLKSGGSFSAADMARVVKNAEARLTDGSAQEFVLITEEKLTDGATTLLKAARAQWGEQRIRHDRSAMSDDVRNRVRDTLTERLTGSTLDLTKVAPMAEVNALVDALLAYVDHLTFPERWDDPITITGNEVDAAIGLCEQLGRWRATILGERLTTWGAWLTEVAQRGDDVARSWHDAATAPWAVPTIAEKRVLECIEQRLESGDGPTVHLVTGRSGAGKTWTLARTASAVAERCDVYVLRDGQVVESPNLARLAKASAPRHVLVLVDDLRHEDVEAALRRSQGAPGLTVLAAAGGVRRGGNTHLSLPRDLDDLVHDLGDDIRLHELPEPSDSRDWHDLARALGRELVTNAMEERLTRSNLRRAASLLGADVKETSPSRLSALWRDQSDHAWAAALLCASAAGARMPRSLLLRHGRARTAGVDVPASVDHLLLVRKTDDGELVWFEEQASGAALADLAERFGSETTRSDRRSALVELVRSIDPSSPRERAFARQLLRSLPAGDRHVVVAETASDLATIAEQDGPADLAYTWLRVLATVPDELADALQRAARAARPPSDAADVIILSAALGPDAAAEAVLEALPVGSWPTAPWTATFNMLKALPSGTARRVSRLALLAFERGTADIDEILRDGGAARPFLEAVSDHGSPRLRLLTHAMLQRNLEDDEPPIGLVGLFLKLAERCVMQERSALALGLAVGAAGPGDHGIMLADGRARFEGLVAPESSRDLIGTSLATTRALAQARMAPATATRAANVWEYHARAASRWGCSDLGAYHEVLACAEMLDDAGIPKSAAVLALASAYGITRSEAPTPKAAAPLLRHFRVRRKSVRDGAAFLVLCGWLAQAEEEPLAMAAAWVIRRAAVGPVKATQDSGNLLGRRIRDWAGLDWSPKMPAPIPYIFERSSDLLLNAYLGVVPHADAAGPVPARVLARLAKTGSASNRSLVFNELFRRGGEPPYADLRAALAAIDGAGGEDRPEVVARRIAFESKYGDADEALRLIRVMGDLQQRHNAGANPFTANRALRAAGTRFGDSARGSMLHLASTLLMMRALHYEDAADMEVTASS